MCFDSHPLLAIILCILFGSPIIERETLLSFDGSPFRKKKDETRQARAISCTAFKSERNKRCHLTCEGFWQLDKYAIQSQTYVWFSKYKPI